MTSLRKRAPNASSQAVRRAMQAVGSENTQPELRLRKALHRLGLRYRVHTRPERDFRCQADIVFRAVRACVFVDGCFWHGCPIHFSLPKTNLDWWLEKIQDNQARDERQRTALEQRGWQVISFWEHQVRDDLEECVRSVIEAIEAGRGIGTT